jgi:AbrB family looped-hinge helix DNA binding protein
VEVPEASTGMINRPPFPLPTVKVSNKHQIVVPKEARDRLNIKKGTKLLAMVRENRLVLIPKPKDYVGTLEGLGKEIWRGDKGYLKRERKSWKN